MPLITYQPQFSQVVDFVNFWERQYNYSLEHLYINNIGQPLTADRVMQLYVWKNGSVLAATKRRSIQQNFIEHIERLNILPQAMDAVEFLNEFPLGGAIWRIFWLHCWQPNRFPIYDQHVHRAMVFIQQQQLEEIPVRDTAKVNQYATRYMPFLHMQFQGVDQRRVDKALMSYGKFLKTYRFPVQ